MRFICWMLIHTVYRLEKSGLENIPTKGPAVLVCNHVSFVDPLVILAASPRPIRFVMDHRIFKTPIVSFVFRTGKAIPIAPAKEDPKLLEDGVRRGVRRRCANGELVAIFPEGRITDTGELYPFRGGNRAHRRARPGAGGAAGAARAVGELLQPRRTGRRSRSRRIALRESFAHRAGGRAARWRRRWRRRESAAGKWSAFAARITMRGRLEMIWLLTIVGALLGAAIGGWAGVVFAFGFLGWLVGFIIKSKARAGRPRSPRHPDAVGRGAPRRRSSAASLRSRRYLRNRGCREPRLLWHRRQTPLSKTGTGASIRTGTATCCGV